MKPVFQIVLLCLALVGCERVNLLTPEGRLRDAVSRLGPGSSEQDRYYALSSAAKESFVVGQTESAKRYAEELLALAQKLPRDWNYGNAIHNGNMVLGRIAVQQGRIDDAKRFLLEAGKSPGSPQLDSFGPNMGLAKDLLEKGEREVVVEYFELCRKFWKLHGGQLDKWSQQVKDGKVPDFGANLDY